MFSDPKSSPAVRSLFEVVFTETGKLSTFPATGTIIGVQLLVLFPICISAAATQSIAWMFEVIAMSTHRADNACKRIGNSPG
jgi:hypothetical protein